MITDAPARRTARTATLRPAHLPGATLGLMLGGMRILSPAFGNGDWIPTEYSADGTESIVPLEFTGVPADTVSLALVVQDSDVPTEHRPDGTFDHWVVWNLPASLGSLTDPDDHGGVVGATSRGSHTWIAPEPPSGKGVHRYYFTVYALDTMLDLNGTAGRPELEAAIEGHVLDQAVLMGRYQRD